MTFLSNNALIRAIEYFVSKLEASIAGYEAKAIKATKKIEALTLAREQHFAEAVRARNVSARIRDLIS